MNVDPVLEFVATALVAKVDTAAYDKQYWIPFKQGEVVSRILRAVALNVHRVTAGVQGIECGQLELWYAYQGDYKDWGMALEPTRKAWNYYLDHRIDYFDLQSLA